MRDIAIGIVVRDGALTHVIREDETLLTPAVVSVDSPLVAAAYVLELHARRYRHDSPTACIDAGGAGSATLDAITEITQREDADRRGLHCQLVSLQADAASSVAGTAFHDRASELVFRFREAADARTLRIPNLDELHEQLDAFTEQPGKAVRFLSPRDVERKIGRYPSIAVAVMLASIGLPRPLARPPRERSYTLAPDHPDRRPKRRVYDPYAALDRFHDPYKDV